MLRLMSRLDRTLIARCCITLIVSCTGCSSIKLADGIEPTRVRSIEKGEARHRVEQLLGKPVLTTQTATGSLVSYQCDLGLPKENLATGRTQGAAEPDEALSSERFLAVRNALFSFMFLGAPEIYARQEIERQKGVAVVTYNAQDRVQDERIRCIKPRPVAEPVLTIY